MRYGGMQPGDVAVQEEIKNATKIDLFYGWYHARTMPYLVSLKYSLGRSVFSDCTHEYWTITDHYGCTIRRPRGANTKRPIWLTHNNSRDNASLHQTSHSHPWPSAAGAHSALKAAPWSNDQRAAPLRHWGWCNWCEVLSQEAAVRVKFIVIEFGGNESFVYVVGSIYRGTLHVCMGAMLAEEILSVDNNWLVDF
jgi:hypothetical protein